MSYFLFRFIIHKHYYKYYYLCSENPSVMWQNLLDQSGLIALLTSSLGLLTLCFVQQIRLLLTREGGLPEVQLTQDLFRFGLVAQEVQGSAVTRFQRHHQILVFHYFTSQYSIHLEYV